MQNYKTSRSLKIELQILLLYQDPIVTDQKLFMFPLTIRPHFNTFKYSIHKIQRQFRIKLHTTQVLIQDSRRLVTCSIRFTSFYEISITLNNNYSIASITDSESSFKFKIFQLNPLQTRSLGKSN